MRERLDRYYPTGRRLIRTRERTREIDARTDGRLGRTDDWSSTAYGHRLDRPENGLPAPASVAQRIGEP